MGLLINQEGMPELPAAPVLPELPKKKDDLPELPVFPGGSNNESFNQEIVKSAVSDISSPGENKVSMEIPSNFHMTEGPGGGSLIPPRPSISSPTYKSSAEDTPIFIRIDKFREVQEELAKINEQISEAISVVKIMKEAKEKEGREISSWETEMEKMHTKLDDMNENIFRRIE